MKIEIYGTEFCISCKYAKQYCNKNNYSYEFKDISNCEGTNYLEELKERLGKAPKTIPQIFVEGKHIGGYDQFVAFLMEQ